MGPNPEVLSQVLVCYVSCLDFEFFCGRWTSCIGHVWVETNPIEIKYALGSFLLFLVRTP